MREQDQPYEEQGIAPIAAAAVTQTALALAGHELDPFTREVTDKMGRGELTGDEAVEAIIAHFAGRSQPV